MATKSGLSNIRSTQLPSRAEVLDDLTSLHARLERAQAEHDSGAVMVARYGIDCALERLLSIASVEEFGPLG